MILVDKEERALRLQKKVEHWIAHNKEYAESFRKAAREAEEIGLVVVSRRLKEAAEKMEAIAAVLEGTMEDLG